MRVSEWFDAFSLRHQERLPRSDWPSQDGEFWATWQSAFVKNGVSEPEADDASRSLAASPPRFPDAQLSALLEAVRTNRAMSQATDAGVGFDAIRKANANCPTCCGNGLLSRRVATERFPDGRGQSFTCDCGAGLYLRACYANDKDLKGRVPSIADYPHLREIVGDDSPRPRSIREAMAASDAGAYEGTTPLGMGRSRRDYAWSTGKPEPNFPAIERAVIPAAATGTDAPY